MGPYVVGLDGLDRGDVAAVGGKAAQLGELARVDGVSVPDGFCVTTEAFRRVMAEAPSMDEHLDRLDRLRAEDRDAIRELSADIRRSLEDMPVPADIAAEVTEWVGRLGEQTACAVRSSATAEDSPSTSFAGQHDSYLGVVGAAEVLRHVSLCWASLFTERAIAYRLRNAFDHRRVLMAVVVQEMVSPDAAGILFTADPVSGDRRVATVEAIRGLGDALVSGRVNPDVYKVRDGAVLDRDLQSESLLTDEQVLRLVQLGRRIEEHFGAPQDIEWCLVDNTFQVVQSRPITTLFPIPERDDAENHVYLSVGHQQMMTDAMKPLGLSFWQLTALRPMFTAGGRLFVDVTKELASPTGRQALYAMAGKSDPLTRDAMETIVNRGDFLPPPPADSAAPARGGPPPQGAPPAPADEPDPGIVAELIRANQESVARLKRDISTKSGPELFDFILSDLEELRRILSAPSNRVWMGAMEATWWLNDHLQEWLGETNAADTLSQSVPHNITSEMGLALLDVADVIRPHPEVVSFLEQARKEDFLDDLAAIPGGPQSAEAIRAFLDRFGMRCAGEIDITRPRWIERPTALIPTILANVRNFEPGAGKQRFEQGLQEAMAKEQELLERLRALPDGESKAQEVKRRIDRLRNFIGYREYPKYGWMSRYFVYRQALMAEADRLAAEGILGGREDIYYLTFQELHEVARTKQVDHDLVAARREAFRSYQGLTVPRVLTSDGEVLTGTYRRQDVPAGALVGLGVSAGTVEGRARVVLDMAGADLEPGDILVTPYTDPSWTPIFVAIKGLVTEVGGLMTHGAVIAREYGLPAVVAVNGATRLIQDGQRIRVHGTEGYVELLS